jgi:hypothetical protein
VPEYELAAIRLGRGERHVRFVADAGSRWYREGSSFEERDFAARFVDRLRRLAVARWTRLGGAAQEPELAEPVAVELVRRSEPPIAFRLGRAAGGAAEFRDDARRAEIEGALLEDLQALLGR